MDQLLHCLCSPADREEEVGVVEGVADGQDLGGGVLEGDYARSG